MSNLIFVLTGSNLINSQKANFEAISLDAELKMLNSTSDDSIVADSCPDLEDGGFAVLQKEGDKIKVLESRNSLDTSVNWAEIFAAFITNYNNTEPDDDGYYRWGQKVPETTDYLCKDCGYVEEFQEGAIFPICEVCLAGEPDGPSTPDQGYWEKL